MHALKSGDPCDLVLLKPHNTGHDPFQLAHEMHLLNPHLPLLLLTTVHHYETALRSHLFQALLTEPLKPHALHEALLESLAPTPRRKTVPATPQNEYDQSTAQQFPLRILVAEDNPLNKKVIRIMLHNLGYQPDTVNNGREALQAVLDADYDLVLMDIQMPEMDGLEATRRIRETVSAERQPVIIALSANALREDYERALAKGMDGYLAKPVKPEQLRDTLARAHTHREHTSPLPVPALASEEHLLDLPYLQHIAEATKMDDHSDPLGELASLFERNLLSSLPLLHINTTQRDALALRRLVHTLKGSASAIGLAQLARTLGEVQDALDAQTFEAWDSLPLRLEREAAHALHQLRLYLKKQRSESG